MSRKTIQISIPAAGAPAGALRLPGPLRAKMLAPTPTPDAAC